MTFPLGIILFALAYWAGVEMIYATPGDFADFWLPSGIYLAVLLRTPTRRWWVVCLTAGLVNFTADVIVHGQPWILGAGYALLNVGLPLASAAALVRWCRPAFSFSSLSHVLLWGLVINFISSLLSAMGGVALKVTIRGGDFSQDWYLWWIGNLLGTLVAMPIALGIIDWQFERKTVRPHEAAALFLSAGLGAWLLFRLPYPSVIPPAVLYLFLMLAALRLGAACVAATSLVLLIIGLWLTSAGLGPYSLLLTMQSRMETVQLLIAVGAFLFYILAAVMAERRTAIGSLQQNNVKLEEDVKTRTAELVRANEELLASETSLQLALDASQTGSWSWDVTTNVSTWDDLYHELYGFEKNAPRTFETWMSSVHVDDRPKLQNRITQMIETPGEDMWNQEFRAVHPKRGERWMLGLGSVERDADGKILRFGGINLDITERKEAEEKLRRSNELFSTLATHAPVGIFRTDAQGNCIYVNDWWMQISGLSFAEALGTGWTKALHPDDRERVWVEWSKAAQNNLSFSGEYRFVNRDGKETFVLGQAIVEKNADGKVLGYVGINTDITKRIEEEKAQAHLAAIVESSDDAIISKNLNSIITSWNYGAEKMFGYTADEAVGQSITMLIPPERQEEESYILENIRQGNVVSHYETVRRRKDGTLFDVSLTVSPVRDESGTIIGASKIARDITKRKETEEQLRVNEERLNLLHHITANPNFTDAVRLEKLLRFGCEQFGLENGVVGEVTGDTYKVAMAVSPNDAIPVGFTCPLTDALCDEVLKQNDLLAIENVGGGEWRAHRAYSVYGTETYFGVPLNVDGRIFGTLCFTSLAPRPTQFTRGDQEFLRLLASTIGAEITRQRFTEQLRVSEERLSLATKGANVGTFDWNIKTGEIQWSAEIIKASGYSPEKFDRSIDGFKKLIYPLDLALVEQRIAEAMKDGNYECEFRMLKADDSIRWLIAKGRVFFDDDGQPARLVGVDIDISKRKQTEEQLRESERFMRSTLDSLTPVIAIIDRDGLIIDVNGAWADFAEANGYNHPRGGLGENYLEIVRNAFSSGDKDVLLILDGLEGVLNGTKGKFEFEYPCHSEDEQRWFLMNVSPLATKQGGAVISHINITERKRAEEKLFKNQQFTQNIIDTSPNVLYTFNLKTGSPTYFTGQTAAILGYSFNELKDRQYEIIRSFMHPDDSKRAVGHFKKVARAPDGEVIEFEYRMRHKSGEWRWFRSRDRVFKRDANGKAEEILGIALDITERKHALEELRSSEEFNRTVLENSPDCVKILDGKGRLEFMNTNGLCLMEIDDFAQLKNKFWWDLWTDEARPQIKAAVKKALRGETASLQAVCPTAKGTPKWWDIIVSPIRGSDGIPSRVISVSRDITETKKAEEEIKALSDYNREVLESITDPFFTLDREYRFTYMTSQGEKLVFRQPGELIGKSLWEEFPGLFGTPFEKMYRDAMEKNITSTVSEFYPDHDRWYDVTAYPSPNGATIYFKDMSERKRSELNLVFLADLQADFAPLATGREIMELASKRLSDYLKLTHCLFVDIDEPQNTATVVHDERPAGVADLTGVYPIDNFHTAEERAALAAGKTIVINNVRDDSREAAAADSFEALGIRSLINASYVSDGTWKFVLSALCDKPRKWRNDECEFLSELASRIYIRLERARAEEALRESEERFRLASDAAATLVYDIDLTGMRDVVTHGLKRVTGYKERDRRSSEWWHSLIHPDDLPEHAEKYETFLRDGGDFFSSYRVRHRKGGWICVEDTAKSITDDQGNPVQIIGTIVDVTQRRLAEMELQKAHDELEERVEQRTLELAAVNDALKIEIKQRAVAEKQRIDLLRKMVTVQEDERMRISRDLHDQFGQELTALRYHLASLQTLNETEAVQKGIDKIQSIASQLDVDLNSLVSQLRPTALDDLGLKDALAHLIDRSSKQFGVGVEFKASGIDDQMPSEAVTSIYRIAQEALNNIYKHSKATHAHVILEQTSEAIHLVVEDNGRGFDMENKSKGKRGFGLTSMQERGNLGDGSVVIKSRPGEGTTIFASLPLRRNGNGNGNQ